MWTLYDELILQVDDEKVKDASIGLYWNAVQSKSVGLAMAAPRPRKNFQLAGNLAGMDVKDLAKLVKSWDQLEASIGLSAINSSINTANNIDNLLNDQYVLREDLSVFDQLAVVGKNKKVAVVGHFPVLDRIKDVCQLTVLERVQQDGDLPDPACEYVLAEQDIVIITSSTIINKTAPRLLQLSKNAFTILIGPSTPLSRSLFTMGADMIAGLIVNDQDRVLETVRQAGDVKNYRPDVTNVNILKNDHKLSELFLST